MVQKFSYPSLHLLAESFSWEFTVELPERLVYVVGRQIIHLYLRIACAH